MTFERVYRDYYKAVLRKFLRFYPEPQAEEYTQDVFQLVAKNFHLYDPAKGAIFTFISRYIMNVKSDIAEHNQGNGRNLYAIEPLADDMEFVDETSLCPHTTYTDRASAIKIICKLPLNSTERQILALMAQNHTLDVISSFIGRSYDYTKSVSNIALKKATGAGTI